MEKTSIRERLLGHHYCLGGEGETRDRFEASARTVWIPDDDLGEDGFDDIVLGQPGEEKKPTE